MFGETQGAGGGDAEAALGKVIGSMVSAEDSPYPVPVRYHTQ